MKTNTTYNQLVQKMYEVGDVQPQTLGPFTPLYKHIASAFKQSPLPLLITAAIGALVLYLFFGTLIVKVASILQYGF